MFTLQRLLQRDHTPSTRTAKAYFQVCPAVCFVSDQAVQRKLEENPALLTLIEDTSLDEFIKRSLIEFHIPTLANLIQFTDKELEMLFDGDKDKVTLIDNYLKEQGLHLYHSDLLTCKLSRKIRQMLDQSKKD